MAYGDNPSDWYWENSLEEREAYWESIVMAEYWQEQEWIRALSEHLAWQNSYFNDFGFDDEDTE